MRVVLKYGGTSVETIEKIKAVSEYIIKLKNSGYDEIVVVTSAMGKMTDDLINKARELSKAPNVRELDSLMSIGEQQSITLLSMALNERGQEAISLTGFQACIKTTGVHTKSRIKSIDTTKIERFLKEGKIVIVAGFQGINDEGDITTLGRGGSDTSAVALAASLGCPCKIYTDVDGIYSIDPRVYPKAKILNCISYEEMMEMAHLGAGVMETRAVELGKKFNVPIFVGRSLSETGGTNIVEREQILEEKLVTGISVTREIIMTNISGVEYSAKNTAEIFTLLNLQGVNVNMIVQNIDSNGDLELSFSSTASEKYLLDSAIEEMKNIFPGINAKHLDSLGMISVVGIGMVNNSGVAGRLFSALSRENIDFYQISTSEISISWSLERELIDRAVASAAREFNL